jgi:exopolysaccharide production protein ExoY
MFDAETEVGHVRTHAHIIVKNSYQAYGKRVFDIVFTISILPIVTSLILLLGILIKAEGGSIFYGHTRLGRNKVQFKCWKLRTMIPNAEQKLKDYLDKNQDQKEIWETTYKLPNDPRVTKIGKLIRKLSFDELPQFWNVLIGDMSIVGPRPVTQKETELYGSSFDIISRVKPGITGLWQVSGRNDITYTNRIELDLDYVKNQTFIGDVKIVLLTIRSILLGTGR